MEVTLNIPFPQKDSPKTTGDQDDNRDDARKTILGLGESELSIHSRGNIKIGGIVSDSTEDEQVLLTENEQINIGSKEGKDSGTSGREGKDDESTDGDAAVYKGQYLGPNSGNRSDRSKLSKKVIPLLNIQNMRAIISSENKTFEYKNQVKRALLSQEYSLAISKWREELNNKIDLRRIFSDAAVLKIHDFNLWGDCYSLQLYAWRLAVYCFDDYRMRIFSEEDYREINKTLGKLIHSHTNDEGEEVASVKKQPKWRKVEIIE